MDEPRSRSEETTDYESAAPSRPILVKRIRLVESELEDRARQVGKAAGTVVRLLREAQRKRSARDPRQSKAPVSDLRPTARGRAEELRIAAALRAQEWRELALARDAEAVAREQRDQLRAVGRKTFRRGGKVLIVVAAVIGFVLAAGIKRARS